MKSYLACLDLLLLGQAIPYGFTRFGGWKAKVVLAALQAAAIFGLFVPTATSVWTAVVLLLATCPLGASSQKSVVDPKSRPRLPTKRPALLAIASIAMALQLTPLHARPEFQSAWHHVRSYISFGREADRIRLRRLLAWTAGSFLCVGPANDALLLSLAALKIGPPGSDASDPRYYRHGGLIGATERILVMIFTVNGAFNAVGFIITAKGLVRFREITDHQEGEYVLVGTLLSTLLAICIGLLVPHLAG